MKLQVPVKVSGRFRAIKHLGHTYDSDKNIVAFAEPLQETPFGKNLITLGGFQQMLTASATIVMLAGDDNTTPLESDTSLGNLLGDSITHTSTSTTRNSTPDVNGNVTWTTTYRYTFNPGDLGTVPVNVAEAGIQLNGNLCSHGLLVDDLGNPTTVSVDPSFEYLDLIWELTFHVPAETTGSVDFTILGSPVSTSYTIRPCFFGNTLGHGSFIYKGWWNAGTGEVPGFNSLWALPIYDVADASSQVRSTNGLGTLLTSPNNDSGLSNTLRQPNNATINSYVPASKERTMKLTWLPARANITGGIQSVMINCNFSQWQISYSPKLGKTSDYQLDLEFKLSLDNL